MARRSVLFSPGDSADKLRTAPSTGADTVVFDLEDGVAPDRKAAARETVREALAEPGFDPDCEVCVRVNPIGVAADDDLAAIAGERPDAFVLPKVDSATDVESFADLLDEHDLSVPVLALVETSSGILAAEDVASAPPTDALLFGAEDLAAEIGARRTAEGTEVLYAREHVVIAASAAGVEAIDAVYTDFEDGDGLEREARFASDLGFDGKMAIHPDQIGPINDAFAPDREEVAWARRVLDAREKHGGGTFGVDGEMIDAPVVRRAERVVARDEAAGNAERDEQRSE